MVDYKIIIDLVILSDVLSVCAQESDILLRKYMIKYEKIFPSL